MNQKRVYHMDKQQNTNMEHLLDEDVSLELIEQFNAPKAQSKRKNDPFATSYGDFLDKDELVTEKTRMTIVHVRENPNGTYGPEWLIDVRFHDNEGGTISFLKNEWRNEQFEKVKTMLPYGPVILTKPKRAHMFKTVK